MQRLISRQEADDCLRQHVKELFWYEPETGLLYRIINGEAGKTPAGSFFRSGHRRIVYRRHIFSAHRVVWLYHTGDWPAGMLDHINCDPADNRIENLRLATRSQNGLNTPLNRNRNTSGYKGVTWNKRQGKWQATIKFDRKSMYLGVFNSPEEAHAAYVKAATEHCGEFARAA